MTDPSGDKDRPVADPTVAYDPPPAADQAPYEPENYDPPSPDATIAAAVPADTADTTVAETPATEAPATETPAAGTPVAAEATVAPEQPGPLPPGAYETPAAYIPGTPFAAPGEPQPVYQPTFQQTHQQPYPPAYGRPYAAPAPFGQPYPGQPRAQDNALAIGALVCSILGFCSGITALAGLIMGHIALSKTNRGEAGGRGLATAAVIVGYVVIALWVGFITTLIILGSNGYLSS
ncbi:DUF4190 domain-containing protein [Amycolatopsis sp. DG1A-15b]|uniref:DUF4190 domain-containing protein n=1 Tax=Amycolatopsis sp. DG1A-15b TaxID=3052846 RepID=UPI00255BCA59|nr:DUF4190 domain-containing protein [Amycolatopsis sp. DG1A-15b]WIX87860.1 DUF4190 domain-containing protein [Amycolatopsis sp. DG1A-15b]